MSISNAESARELYDKTANKHINEAVDAVLVSMEQAISEGRTSVALTLSKVSDTFVTEIKQELESRQFMVVYHEARSNRRGENSSPASLVVSF
ncbi:hypothetical protein LCGC14_2155250 [marine sediment metagenome]|uniref:Uncharacterized protein n=1 Tax=marine sediment metagenome TaxID=412755 RepID=A0A0F9DU94_9ZZZZ